MIKKTIEYHDYEGNMRKDDFYFNLTQIEMNKINSDPTLPGGIEASVNRAVKNEDAGEMLRIIDLLISRSYGMKLPDGSFVKRNATGLPLYEAFVNTEAYDNLLTELISGGENVVGDFLIGCLPTSAQEKVQAEVKKRDLERKQAGDLELVKAGAESAVV